MSARKEDLSLLPLFRPCRESTLQFIRNNSQILSFRPRESLFHPDSVMDAVFVQLTGSSFRYAVTRQGQRRVFDFSVPGDLLNAPFQGEKASFAHCEMLEAGQVLSIPKEVFAQALQEDFALVEAVLAQQQQTQRRMEHRLRNGVSSLHGRVRMASELLELAEEFGVKTGRGIQIPLPLTVTLLADLLGMPRETASRLRKGLAEDGFLWVEGRRITLTDVDALERLCQVPGYHPG